MIRTRLRFLAAIALIAAIIPAALTMTSAPSSEAGATLGGPVILGGDDLTAHGSVDGSGNVQSGWLYMKRALAAIEADTNRGDGSIAALGSAASAETNGGDAGAAIGAAAQELGLAVTYYDGGPAIDGFFAALGGSADPSIIWIAGDDASNDLSGDAAEVAALTAGATAISSFVSSGGGLMSHGTEYAWLTALLPSALAVDSGGGSLYFTAEGLIALTGLLVGDINAGPWHNHFEGDFGGLEVLVRSSTTLDSLSQDAAVIIGGSQVTFEENPAEPTAVPTEGCEELIPGIPCGVLEGGSTGGGGGGGGSPSVPATPVPAAPTSTLPPVAPTQPSGGQQGIITAPDTGSGPGAGSSPTGYLIMAALLALTGVTALGASFGFARRR